MCGGTAVRCVWGNYSEMCVGNCSGMCGGTIVRCVWVTVVGCVGEL